MLASLILSLVLTQNFAKQCMDSCSMQDAFMKNCESASIPRDSCKEMSEENRKLCQSQCAEAAKMMPKGGGPEKD